MHDTSTDIPYDPHLLNAQLLRDLRREMDGAQTLYGSYASMHEAYAVIKEELEEFWTWVKLKEDFRDSQAMRVELLQVAACALRAILTLEEQTQKGIAR